MVTAENKCAGKLNTNTWARRDEDGRVEDGRVEKWLLLHGARRRLARLALKNIYQNKDSRGEEQTDEDVIVCY